MKKEKQLSSDSMSTILTTFIFAIAGAVPIFTAMGVSAGLEVRAVSSIIMCGMFVSGLLSVYLSKRFRMPIYAAPSITAVAVIGPLLKDFSLAEMVFGYLAAGAVLMILGGFKFIGKIIKYVPIPIVLAMVAGVYMSYGLNLVAGVKTIPLAGGIIVAAYFTINLFLKKFPPQAAALIAAILVTCFLMNGDAANSEQAANFAWQPPVFILPAIKLNVLLYVSLPLVIMSISDMFKGYGVLKANGFDLSLDKVAVFCGGCSVITAFGLGHTISLAGPAIAILAGKDAGEKTRRYIGAMIFSGITALVVLLSGLVIGLVSMLSAAVINIICGLAMIGLLTSSLTEAFGAKRYIMGALTSFVIGLSHLSFFGIGAPVWAIIFGIVISFLVERDDFINNVEQEKKAS